MAEFSNVNDPALPASMIQLPRCKRSRGSRITRAASGWSGQSNQRAETSWTTFQLDRRSPPFEKGGSFCLGTAPWNFM